jgi:orotate phosphoribosyltransferase
VSTGASSLKAVEALRKQQCDVVGMVAIFSYLFPQAAEAFKQANVKLLTLSNYEEVLDEALATNYIGEHDIDVLKEWRQNPSVWNPAKQ